MVRVPTPPTRSGVYRSHRRPGAPSKGLPKKGDPARILASNACRRLPRDDGPWDFSGLTEALAKLRREQRLRLRSPTPPGFVSPAELRASSTSFLPTNFMEAAVGRAAAAGPMFDDSPPNPSLHHIRGLELRRLLAYGCDEADMPKLVPAAGDSDGDDEDPGNDGFRTPKLVPAAGDSDGDDEDPGNDGFRTPPPRSPRRIGDHGPNTGFRNPSACCAPVCVGKHPNLDNLKAHARSHDARHELP